MEIGGGLFVLVDDEVLLVLVEVSNKFWTIISFGVVQVASTTIVAGWLGLVGFIPKLSSKGWPGARPILEAGRLLVIVGARLLLVRVSVIWTIT